MNTDTATMELASVDVNTAHAIRRLFIDVKHRNIVYARMNIDARLLAKE